MRIDDLARNLIKLSGLRPDEDIKIQVQDFAREKNCMRSF